jgi:hypothetical protein
VVHSITEFLNGAFPTNNAAEGTAYMYAWQREKEEFEKSKSILESVNSSSLGWSYEDKINVSSVELPSPEAIVNSVERTGLDGNKQIHSTIDTVMSTMMNECGKMYLNYVGGKTVLDEESVLMATLAERIAAEKKKREEKNVNVEEAETQDVEQLTQQMEELHTNVKPETNASPAPTTRIRILSVIPVKKSKRRGEIGGRVELVLYPPDPCLIFKEVCREAGRIAAERLTSKVEVVEEVAKIEERANDGEEKTDTSNDNSIEAAQPTTSTQQVIPTIPNFPRLSPAERSKAIARSRILMDRTISAMKIHAQSLSNDCQRWEIIESSSQKTWKGQSHELVTALMSGESLSKWLEAEESKNDGDKKVRRAYARGDRYDSTIENSEDYKAFMEMWKSDGPIRIPAAGEKSINKPTKEEKLDEEGRPISAIVKHLQSKREEEARVKAEAAAAASRARAKASAEAAREKARKKELEAKTRKAKARMKREEERKKMKVNGGKVSSRPGGSSSGGAAPPPGAVLLKKGSAPTSGFNSK